MMARNGLQHPGNNPTGRAGGQKRVTTLRTAISPHQILSLDRKRASEAVYTRDGGLLGHLQELLIDQEGRIIYGVIACDAHAQHSGGGIKLVPVPWAAFEPAQSMQNGNRLTLDVQPNSLRQARGYDPDHWPSMRLLD